MPTQPAAAAWSRARSQDIERHAALREAFAALPPSDRELIAMLTAEQPVPYTEISAQLGIPVGSIGPTRRRCLDKMRRHPAIAAMINDETQTARGEIPTNGKVCS